MLKAGTFAELIGVSKQQVNNYRNNGMPSIKKGNYYYFSFDAIEWLYITGKREVKIVKENDKNLTLTERKTLIEVKLKELEYDKKTDKVVNVELARRNGAKAGLMVRDTFSSLPDRFIPTLPISEEDKHIVKVKLKEEIYNSLLRISQTFNGK